MNKNAKKLNKIMISCLACFFAIFAVVMVFNAGANVALAETTANQGFVCQTTNSEATPMGIYTYLSLSINGGDGKVWATAKNDVTLFPAKVMVVVELYSSETYSPSYLTMTLEAVRSIDDLNMGKTLTVEASTGGFQKYWQARMCYKIDGGGWKSEVTGCILCDAEGGYLPLQ